MEELEDIKVIAQRFCDQYSLGSPDVHIGYLYWIARFRLSKSVLSINLDGHDFKFYVEVKAGDHHAVRVSKLRIKYGGAIASWRARRLLEGTFDVGNDDEVRHRFASILDMLGPHLAELEREVVEYRN